MCLHCRGVLAQAWSDPNELTTELSRQLIDQITEFPTRPMLVLTGGRSAQARGHLRSDRLCPRARAGDGDYSLTDAVGHHRGDRQAPVGGHRSDGREHRWGRRGDP